MEGSLVFTKYASGCLRHIFLRSQGVKEEIDFSHKERGALNEDLFAEKFQGVPSVRERPFRVGLLDDPNAVVSGRVDYLAYPDDPDRKEIIELKSTESGNVYRSVIRDGVYNLQNIAQVVWYMLAERCNNTRLIHTYFKRDKKTKVLKRDAERVFKVAVEDDGVVTVDGTSIGFNVSNVTLHATEAVRAISEKLVSARPYSPSTFENPCRFCPFNSACSYYDDGLISTTEDFVKFSQQALDAKQAAALIESEKSE